MDKVIINPIGEYKAVWPCIDDLSNISDDYGLDYCKLLPALIVTESFAVEAAWGQDVLYFRCGPEGWVCIEGLPYSHVYTCTVDEWHENFRLPDIEARASFVTKKYDKKS